MCRQPTILAPECGRAAREHRANALLGEIIASERGVVAVEIDLKDTVDRLADHGELVKRGLEKAPLQIPINGGNKNDEPGVRKLCSIEMPKAARVVGEENEVAVAGVAHYVPVFPA